MPKRKIRKSSISATLFYIVNLRGKSEDDRSIISRKTDHQ